MPFRLKGCPRCGGDLFLERDLYGAYYCCLQCGYILEPESQKGYLGEFMTVAPADALPGPSIGLSTLLPFASRN